MCCIHNSDYFIFIHIIHVSFEMSLRKNVHTAQNISSSSFFLSDFFFSFLFLHRLHSCRRQNVYAAYTLMCIYIFVFFCFLNYVNCATLTTSKLMMTTMGDIIIECYTYIHTSTYVEAYESERMKEKRRRKCGAIIRRQNE